VVVLDLLLASFTLLLDQTIFQPVLEGPVAFLLLDLFVEALLFFFSELLLLLKSLSD